MKQKIMLTIVLLPLLAFQPVKALSTPDYWPTEGWLSTTPEEQEMDSTVLAGMYSYIEEQNLDIHSLIVIKHGYIVEEVYPSAAYELDTRHTIHSCTKSIISALIGIALNKGFISSVDQNVLDFFPNREITNLDPHKQILTLEHLLTMTSGLDWDEWPANNTLFSSWYSSEDIVQFVLDRPVLTEPGKVFNYNSGTVHLLSAIIHQATESTTFEFAEKYLFGPLGITNLYWPRDPQGIYTGGGGLALTPRDMAKIGYLYLNKGRWDGEQIVSSEWVEVSTKAQISASSHISGCEYGYLWWIYPAIEAYAALGWAGQQIFVIPDHELVVVFTGDIYNFPPHYVKLIGDFIIPADKSGLSELNRETPFLLIIGTPGILVIVIWRKRIHRT